MICDRQSECELGLWGEAALTDLATQIGCGFAHAVGRVGDVGEPCRGEFGLLQTFFDSRGAHGFGAQGGQLRGERLICLIDLICFCF